MKGLANNFFKRFFRNDDMGSKAGKGRCRDGAKVIIVEEAD
ncbi:hypothetical protein JOD02_001782 [Caldicoprobacter guelmensis]|nr:hypothetical protein [Caldicoprobacter guelmensis]